MEFSVFATNGSINGANIETTVPSGTNRQNVLLVKGCEMAQKHTVGQGQF